MSKKMMLMFHLVLVLWLAGCNDEHFDTIDHHQSFIASVNIQQPSIQFFDQEGHELATWSLKRAYTGAVLVQNDTLLLYGNQLDTADLYELSSGEHIAKIQTGVGTTNALYAQQQIFITNNKTNTVTSYDVYGKKIKQLKLGNYPMSMAANDDFLYVVNYKDTKLSVINIKQLKVVDQWEIEKSSHGMTVLPEQRTLWLGGHGAGNKPNKTVDIFDLQSGQRLKELNMPIMPVGFDQSKEEVAVISHGSNILYVADKEGNIKWQQEIAANPFAVAMFDEQIVIAGYDDHTLYFVNHHKIVNKINVGQGPFQLIVRESEK